MSITVESTRFGTIEVPAESVLEFPAGLIGLGGSRYVLLAREESAPFVWLQSVDDPALALAVTNPFEFFPAYEVELPDSEAERIGIGDPAETEVWVTVRAGESVEDFTVNLRAPILVAHGRGFQVINEAEHAPVRASLFAPATAEAAA
jgi:flagellar assembly factor FliW